MKAAILGCVKNGYQEIRQQRRPHLKRIRQISPLLLVAVVDRTSDDFLESFQMYFFFLEHFRGAAPNEMIWIIFVLDFLSRKDKLTE